MPFKFISSAALCLAATILFANVASAQNAQTEKIFRVAVVDISQVMATAKAPQSIRAQINEKRKIFQAEIQKEEKELREGDNELTRQRTIMAPEAFKEERRKFQERLVDAQRKMQERRLMLDRSYAAAMDKVGGALNTVIDKIVKDNAITLLLRKEQTVFADKGLIITEYVVKELDKLLPNVTVFTKDGEKK